MSDHAELALSNITPMPPPTRARELGFSDKIFDMLAEKEAIKDLGEYIEQMRGYGMDSKEGRHMFEFLFKEIIEPRMKAAGRLDEGDGRKVTPEAAIAMIEQVMQNRRAINQEVEANYTVEQTVAEKAKLLRGEVPDGP